jgi:LacI family transcriptional regulator
MYEPKAQASDGGAGIGLPRVAVSAGLEPPGRVALRVANEAGMRALTSYLIRLGHQAIGHAGWQAPAGEAIASGFRKALADHGIGEHERCVSLVPQRGIEAGRLAAWLVFEQAPEITAITCYDDLMAVGVLDVCAETGRRVPEDMAVVGFGGYPLSRTVRPALTTMRVPWRRMGELAIEMLIRSLRAADTYDERQELASRLVVRDSCGGREFAAEDLVEAQDSEDHIQLAFL